MPVIKVPTVHKFGIISHCQRLQLQTRLFDEIAPEKVDALSPAVKDNPFEISDELVENYNLLRISTTANKEKLEIMDKIEKIFLKIKRRVGLQHNCESEPHINLALGWTELSIMSQCEGDIGQESLNLLLLSLNTAPITNRAFSVLFYLLETVLYFIQVYEFVEATPQKHIKWLHIGEIVAVRIYLQCSLKMSPSWMEKLENLTIYIKDFKKCHSKFTQYPELAVPFCVIEEVTDYLISTSQANELTTEENKKETLISSCGSFLWHSIDLCRCLSYSFYKSQIKDCIEGIRNCLADNTLLGEWIECYLAIRIIANGASFSETGLDVFISIIYGLNNANNLMTEKNVTTVNVDINKISSFKRGELLLMVAMREFSTLPLLAKSSLVRERSLSTIAEMLLSKKSAIIVELPLKMKEVVVSRIEALLQICERNKLSLSVIKNSLWCLLGAIKRKRILSSDEEDFSEKYGTILVSTLYSDDSNEMPQTANGRITKLLIEYLLPAFPGKQEISSKSSENNKNDKTLPSVPNIKKQRVKVGDLPKKKPLVTQGESRYKQQSNDKLKNILENYWNQELPVLKKALDEIETTTQSK